MKLSFRAQLAILTTSVLLGTLVVIAVYGYLSAMQTVDALTQRSIRQTSSLIDQRIGALLRNAESQSKLLAGLLTPGGLPTEKRVDSTQFHRLATEMYEMMRVNPEFGYVTVSLSDTGEYLQVIQEPDGSLLIQSAKRDQRGRLRREDLVPHGGELSVVHIVPDWSFDPRTRPFYAAAEKAKGQVWTDTYVFASETGPETPGVTCATPVFADNGKLLAVVTVDFTLGDLSRFLQTISVGDSGYAFLADVGEGRPSRAIAHPKADKLLIRDNQTEHVATIEELGIDTSTSLVRLFLKDKVKLEPGEVRRRAFDVGGVSYVGSYQKVSGDRAPQWVMFLVVPTSDFIGPVREAGMVLALFGLAALCVGVAASWFLARRVAQPLQALSEETSRIRALQLEPRPLPETSIIEVDQLASAVEHMKTGLRSFEKLVPAEYARWLMSSGQEAKLGGRKQRLTVYFADLMGFTSFSEQLQPEEIVEALSDYLDYLSQVVIDMGGTVDKFNGDDVMAFFGAPAPMEKHALAACCAAVESVRRLEDVHTIADDLGKPKLQPCFGICTGDVIVGNIGSRHRMNYTVVGDSANLASRIQGLNKYYQTSILMDEGTMMEVGNAVVSRLIDTVAVFGRAQATNVYELLALADEAAPVTKELAAIHAEGMRLYHARKWEMAAAQFDRVVTLCKGDVPAQILSDRCKRYAETPPPELWDGTYRMEIK